MATADDAAFLAEMLAIAADWRPGTTPRTVSDVIGDPDLAHYIRDWPIEGDVGVVAEADRLVGAAWWRFFPPDNRGYGFVDSAIPELSIGVVERTRGPGQGQLLLQALIEKGRELGLQALSLSVEPDNPAKRLSGSRRCRGIGDDGLDVRRMNARKQLSHPSGMRRFA
jgi:ribosomal protein S18 acetylase RimI-like enzyme